MRPGKALLLEVSCCLLLAFFAGAARADGPPLPDVDSTTIFSGVWLGSSGGSIPVIDVQQEAGLWLYQQLFEGNPEVVCSDMDFNGDSIADLIVNWDGGDTGVWETEIFLGNRNLGGVLCVQTDSDISISRPRYYYLNAVADFNGDSRADLAFCYILRGWHDAYLIFGKPVSPPVSWSLPDDADVTLIELATEDHGVQVHGSGDINGDGYWDLSVSTGAYGYPSSQLSVLLGSPGMSGVINASAADVKVDLHVSEGVTMSDWAFRQDINGDGCDEIRMTGKNADGQYEARVWLGEPGISGPTTITAAADAQIVMDVSYIYTCDDVSGDEIGDILSYSKIKYGQSGSEPRVIELADADVTFTSLSPDLGWLRVKVLGDANGDGISDVLVEEKLKDPSPDNPTEFATYLFLGGATLGGTHDVTEAVAVISGYYCAVCAGDINGDGFDDFVFEHRYADPKMYAVVFGPLVEASYVQAGNAAGLPGQEDVPVRVYLESLDSVTLAGMIFTLHYDDTVLVPPADDDVSTEIAGMALAVNTSEPGEVVIGLVSSSGEDVTISRHENLAVIEFDVQAGVSSGATCNLTTQVIDALRVDGAPVLGLVGGPAGVFRVHEIIPRNPEVCSGDHIHFITTFDGDPMWSLTQSLSGGEIDEDTGLYQAGSTSQVTDEVMVSANGHVATTEVIVQGGERPAGVPGAPTSMDVDGGGVALSDVIEMLRYLVGLETLTPAQREAADFDCDNDIGLDDVMNALRVAIGLPPIVS